MAQGRPGQNKVLVRPESKGRGLSAVLWGDADRRRALLLSVLIHAGILLTVVVGVFSPPQEQEEPERLIVLELTPPQGGAGVRDAAAAELPAPQRAESEVAGNATNERAGAPEGTAAETQAEAPPQDEAQGSAPMPAETADAPLSPSESPPQARVPSTSTPPQTLPEQAPSTTLPEVEAPDVAPQTPQESIALPTPTAQAEVTPSRTVIVTPQAEVAQSQPLPTPDASVSLRAEPIVIPQADAQVAPTNPIPQPGAGASVATRDVPQPQVDASVAQASPIPQPSVSGEAVAAAPLPQPQAGASVAPGRPLTITPRADVGAATPLETPDVSATVTLPEPAAGVPAGTAAGGGAEGGSNVAGAQTAEAAEAGDGATSGQAAAAPEDATGEGAAADDSGVAPSGVANVQSYEVTRDQPLDVLIDNADAAYPQQGLVEASSVFEMPVEGGLTRLMAVYTEGEPVQVGPIRSARDYFLEAALQMNGTLVHVGGAPSTVSRIASQRLATVDALQEGSLFAQAPDRLAPHSTFSTGEALREAVGRLPTPVSGTLYAPPSDAPNVNTLTVTYSADYSSGFRYLNDLDQYRWVRSGADAADTEGEAVTADAVVVAQVTALPYPDDPEGRLYLPYSGGPATLYLRGKAVAGSWTPEGGFAFMTESGEPVDLRPFKAWLLFAPETAQLTQQ